MATSAQNLAALRREIARAGGRRNPSNGGSLRHAELQRIAEAHVGGLRTLVKQAKEAGLSARGEEYSIPTDNFWYAWLVAALARGAVRNETGDRFTKQLSDMTLREIAEMADTDPSFYDT